MLGVGARDETVEDERRVLVANPLDAATVLEPDKVGARDVVNEVELKFDVITLLETALIEAVVEFKVFVDEVVKVELDAREWVEFGRREVVDVKGVIKEVDILEGCGVVVIREGVAL